MKNPAIVITDFDGTLADNEKFVSDANIKVLNELGRIGVPRVIATGRNMYSLLNVVTHDLPVDYIVFSTGAGVYDWKEKKLLHKNVIPEKLVKFNSEIFIENRKDFMLHLPIPDNHIFYYNSFNEDNEDFFTRVNYYGEHARVSDGNINREATQLLAVLHKDQDNELTRLSAFTKDVKVIKTTSPITGKALWMEIFPDGISKASGIHWLCNHLNLDFHNTLAVGNDYNDLDMLESCSYSYVTGNAPDDLLNQFESVSDVGSDGFSEAVKKHFSF